MTEADTTALRPLPRFLQRSRLLGWLRSRREPGETPSRLKPAYGLVTALLLGIVLWIGLIVGIWALLR